MAGDDDNDGLTGQQEATLGSNPFSEDSDGDGLLDGEEVTIYGTDPTLADTDSDGLTDLAEIQDHHSDPTLADTDLDGILDGDEVAAGTNPLAYQADGNSAVTQTGPTAVPPTLSPPTNQTPGDGESAVAIAMDAAQSGWLTNDGDVNSGSGNWPQAGDLVNGTAVRGLLTFSLNELPGNALVRTAFLRFSSDSTLEGAPFDSMGCLQIDFVEVSQTLDNTAYDAPGFFISCEVAPPNSIDITLDVEDALIQGQTQLSLRLGFETDSNGDSVADLYVVRTAPTLEVTYLLP